MDEVITQSLKRATRDKFGSQVEEQFGHRMLQLINSENAAAICKQPSMSVVDVWRSYDRMGIMLSTNLEIPWTD